MAEPVVVPEAGMTVAEGTLARWLVADGAAVKEHDALFEVETEKVEMEVEAQGSGILRHLMAEGTALKPGDVVGCLVAPGEEVPASLRRAVAAQGAEPALGAPPPGEAVPYTGRRRTIGTRMMQSLGTMAQLTLTRDVPMDAVQQLVHQRNRDWRSDGVAMTLTHVVVKACAVALREHPHINARLQGESIILLRDVNIGIAADADAGLMVPVVRNVDQLSLKGLAQAVRELSARAKDDSLALEDVSEGTFTVTTLGAVGIDAFTPIIKPPQAAILGIGRLHDVAVFDGPNVVRGRSAVLSLSFDHRVNDGAPAARFLGSIAALLADPGQLSD